MLNNLQILLDYFDLLGNKQSYSFFLESWCSWAFDKQQAHV